MGNAERHGIIKVVAMLAAGRMSSCSPATSALAGVSRLIPASRSNPGHQQEEKP
jgi:hypothetical protein